MTRSAERPVVHEIVGGFCRVCGDTAEYLVDRGRDVVEFVDLDSVRLTTLGQ